MEQCRKDLVGPRRFHGFCAHPSPAILNLLLKRSDFFDLFITFEISHSILQIDTSSVSRISLTFNAAGHCSTGANMENPEDSGDSTSVNPLLIGKHDDAACKQDVESQPSCEANDLATIADEKARKDPNIVDWDGLGDPANPMNWPSLKKFTAIGIVSLITMLSQVTLSGFN